MLTENTKIVGVSYSSIDHKSTIGVAVSFILGFCTLNLFNCYTRDSLAVD
jgi:hypothetical protein